MSALSDVENLRLHDIADGDVRDDPRWLALMGEGAVKAFLAEMAAKHLRGEHDQSSHGRRGGSARRAAGAIAEAAAKPFDDLGAWAELDVASGESHRDRRATEKVAAGAAKRLATGWDVSDGDLEKVLREEGAWSHFESMSPAERREGYVRRLLTDWNGSSGGPVPTAAITSVADDLGLDYELSDSETRTNRFIRNDPALSRVAESLGKAMYQQTQAWFAERGITHVQAGRSSRGADFDAARPFTSWSLGEHGSAFVTGATERENRSEVIPVERIFSIPPTGFGNMEEAELIVLPEGKSGKRAGRRRVKHLPGQHNQDSHGNDHGGIDVPNPLDKLKLGKRAPAGFTVRSSKKIKTDYADVGVAEVDGPDGPQVRIGIIGNESGKWDAGFTGESRKAELRRQIADKRALMDSDSDDVDDDIEDQISDLESELEDLEGERTAIVSPEQMADFRRQLGEGLEVAKANKAKVDADMKVSEAIDEKRDAIIAEHSDPGLEKKVRELSWRLRQAQGIVRDLENDLTSGRSRHGWDPEFTAERLASWKANVAKYEAELAPLLARRAEIMPPDARARLEDLDRQFNALNDPAIDDMLTAAEVSAPNGARIRAEIWGSDDEDEQWVSTRLYVLTPGETSDDIDDDYGSFRGLKGLNKLIAGLELSGDQSKSFRDTQGKHLPGRHDQRDHGRRRGPKLLDAAPSVQALAEQPKPRRAPKPKPPRVEPTPAPTMPTAKPRVRWVPGANTDASARAVGEYVKFDKVTLANNASLRSAKPSPKAKAWRDRMAMAIQSQRIENDSLVHRGGAFKPEMIAQLKPGAVITDAGVTSTDVDREAAEFYAQSRLNKKPGHILTMFDIKVPAGMPGYDADYGEFVFGPDASMRILSTRDTPNGIEVSAEMIPPERG